MAYQIVQNGMHQNGRVCAAFFRECVSDESTKALENNKIPKLQLGADVTYRLRKKAKNSKTARPLDYSVMTQARGILSQMTTGQEGAEKSYQDLTECLASGAAASDSRLRSARFTQVMKKVDQTSDLAKNLMNQRKRFANNSGNRTKGKGKSKNKAERADNDAQMKGLLKSHGPTRIGDFGPPFWIRNGQCTIKPEPGTQSKCGVDFPGERLVFENLTLMGVRQRFKEEKKRKMSTRASEHLVENQYKGLSLLRVPSEENKNAGVVVTRKGIHDKATGYALVQIYKKIPKDKPEKICNEDEA